MPKKSATLPKPAFILGFRGKPLANCKKAYEIKGENGLVNNKPCPENPKLLTDKAIEEKILDLRTTNHFGPLKISWYLERFHDIKVSRSGCYYVLLRNGLNRLPEKGRKRSMPEFIRYEKKVTGHPVQVDVKFLFLRISKAIASSAFNIPPSMTQPVSGR